MTGTLLLFFNVAIRHEHLSYGFRGVKIVFVFIVVLEILLLLDISGKNVQKSDSAGKFIMKRMLICPKILRQ